MTLECARDEKIRLCISEMTGETIFLRRKQKFEETAGTKTVSLEHSSSNLSKIDRFAEIKEKLENSKMQKKTVRWQNGKTVKWQNGKTVKWKDGKTVKWQNVKAIKWQNCEEVNLLHLETKPDWLSTLLL